MDKFTKDNSKKYIPMLDLLEKTNYHKIPEKEPTPYESELYHSVGRSISNSIGKSMSESTI
jgi:hypothetical protein